MEIWNLVFMQYEDQAGGKRISLPKPSIDTGMGLERISSVLQGKTNNFEIDLFKKIIDNSMRISGDKEHIASHRVIADHLRSGCFLMADGVMPSNEGRGYVLRRILRRAIRHAHKIGTKTPLIHQLVPTLISEMGEYYSELKRAEAIIKSTLELEEVRFRQTIDNGMKLLNSETEKLKKGDVLDGTTAFKLYDTYGFPLDLTCDILKEKGITVDQETFNSEMKIQKDRARASWKGSGETATEEVWFNIHENAGATEFLGYSTNTAEAVIKAIVVDAKSVDSARDCEAILVVNQTPFYAESGGQIGDTGTINNSQVFDTKKYIHTIYGHFTKVKGQIKVGDKVQLKIDADRRKKIKANHSATHLLHKALREVLGETVTQKGSLVAPDRLRFDFSHAKSMTIDEIQKVEILINQKIIENAKVNTDLTTPEQAIKKGAMALFGEKYGDEVRVVSMGDSMELCGGTHVNLTGDIGILKITSEEAIASGIRRIEAVTGIAALEYANQKESILKDIASNMKCSESDIPLRIKVLQEDKKNLEKEITKIRIQTILANDCKPENINGVEFLVQKLEGIPPQDLKSVIDALKNKVKSGVIAISSIYESKVSLVVYVTSDITGKIKAGDLVKEAAKMVDGNGGGRPDFAQAGGTNISGIDSAIDTLKSMIK
jgi:alanyl-tRNA synthetase